ncbi:MAG TPA: carboxylesterase/lipase family protein [Candidatus Acidoferrum sp.]|nr:carboxylesterase/lipase family protein [Candidatus Acidoferrum sp.]
MIRRREFVKSSLVGTALLSVPLVRAILAADSASLVVATKYGKVRGISADGVCAFKGVHYGASPEGAGRFMPAAAPKPWIGVFDALEYGTMAPQILSSATGSDIRIAMGDIFGPGDVGEDCLVLNVWTPSVARGKRPVMVWLHGGGYTGGSDGAPTYDGANLARKQDVVVVGINHRLNVFGYLYLGEIGGEKYADSGNVGMLDIVLALKWVRDNIAHFGGDPGNVTIFGESGGGGKVGTLMAMPPAKGLFHKAIVESGSMLRVSTRDEGDAAARKFLAQLKIEPDQVHDLQNVPMSDMLATFRTMTGPNAIRLGPVVDGRSLPRQPFDPDAPAQSASVPMIIGTNGTETTALLGIVDPSLFSLSEAEMRTKLETYLHLADDSQLDGLIATYKKARPDATPSDIYFAVTTDRMMRMNAITQAERKAAQDAAPAYMYIFDWRSPVLGGEMGSPHGIELAFVFDNTDKTTGMNGTGADLAPLAEKMSTAWAAFARTGNPNHSGLPHWPAYDADSRATMIFNDECKVVDDPGRDERLAITALPTA